MSFFSIHSIFLTALLSASLYLLFTTTTYLAFGTTAFVPYHPLPPPLFEGVLAQNDKLTSVVQVGKDQIEGPESVAFDSKGNLFVPTADGYIWKIHENDKGKYITEKYLYIGGRPLGLKVDKHDNLIVAEPSKGLLSVNAETKEITILANIDNEEKLISTANDLEITAAGDKIYFTDSTPLSPVKLGKRWVTLLPALTAILTSDPQGRLLEYDVATRTTRVLFTDLVYANGLAMAKDESFILVAESGRTQVWKYHLKGEKQGTAEIFADNLPGYPDGLSTASDGNFYIAFYNKRSPIIEPLNPYPILKKLAAVLIRFVTITPPPIGFIAKLDQNGKIIEALFDPTGQRVHTISDVEEHDGKLYIGSLTNKWVSVYTLPPQHDEN